MNKQKGLVLPTNPFLNNKQSLFITYKKCHFYILSTIKQNPCQTKKNDAIPLDNIASDDGVPFLVHLLRRPFFPIGR